MINLTSFHPLIRLEAPEAPSGLMNARLLSAAIEFCRESLIWFQDITPITTIADQTDYSVADPAGAKIVQLYQLKLAGEGIKPTFSAPASFSFEQAPNADLSITGKMALIPSLDATQLPDLLYDQYQEALVSGALARLLAQPKQPWTDPAMAGYHRNVFDAGMFDAKVKAMRSFGSHDAETTPNLVSLGVTA